MSVPTVVCRRYPCDDAYGQRAHGRRAHRVSVGDGDGWMVDLVAEGGGPWQVRTATRSYTHETGVVCTDAAPTFGDFVEAVKFSSAVATAAVWLAKADFDEAVKLGV